MSTDHAREAANEIMALDHRTLKHNPEAPRRIIQSAIDAACAELRQEVERLRAESKDVVRYAVMGKEESYTSVGGMLAALNRDECDDKDKRIADLWCAAEWFAMNSNNASPVPEWVNAAMVLNEPADNETKDTR